MKVFIQFGDGEKNYSVGDTIKQKLVESDESEKPTQKNYAYSGASKKYKEHYSKAQELFSTANEFYNKSMWQAKHCAGLLATEKESLRSSLKATYDYYEKAEWEAQLSLDVGGLKEQEHTLMIHILNTSRANKLSVDEQRNKCW